MRVCRHCSHPNADHLSYCSQCGRRLAPITGDLRGAATAATVVARPDSPAPARPSHPPMTVNGAILPTMLGGLPQVRTPPGRANGNQVRPGKTSVASWAAGSIGYIYVFLRGKLDAGERRRRLIEEREGAERLLSGATKELGAIILREGIQQSDLTGLLEAIGRAEARREAALADIEASERLQLAEEARLVAQEEALEAELYACDSAHREAEEMLRAVSTENQEATTRLARIKEDLDRLTRSTMLDPSGAERGQAARLKHETAALAGEQAALLEQSGRLQQQVLELRERSAALRMGAAAARSKRDVTIATRRQAASAMGASIAGHRRDRADAEREISALTEQLGRAAAQAPPQVPMLQPLLARIDRLMQTAAERASEISALDQAAGHYDQRKLLTGVGLVTSLVTAVVAGLWVALR